MNFRYSVLTWVLVWTAVAFLGMSDSESAQIDLGKTLVITRRGWTRANKFVVQASDINAVDIETDKNKKGFRVVLVSGHELMRVPLTDVYFHNQEKVKQDVKVIEDFLLLRSERGE